MLITILVSFYNVYVYKIIMLYSLYIHNYICQLFLDEVKNKGKGTGNIKYILFNNILKMIISTCKSI